MRPRSVREFGLVFECNFPAQFETPRNTPQQFGRPGSDGLSPINLQKTRRAGGEPRHASTLAFRRDSTCSSSGGGAPPYRRRCLAFFRPRRRSLTSIPEPTTLQLLTLSCSIPSPATLTPLSTPPATPRSSRSASFVSGGNLDFS